MEYLSDQQRYGIYYIMAQFCAAYDDCTNTDIKGVFDLILDTAIEYDLNQNDLPDNILTTRKQ